MSVRHKRLLWLWGELLAALFCLWFLPLTMRERGLSVLLVAGVALAGLWLAGRRSREQQVEEVSLHGLPDTPYRLPVVLVCGDTGDWPGDSPVYRTAQGCWLKVPEVELQQTVRQLLWLRPELVSQLAVMACVAPQQHEDRDTFTGRLLTLRWQMVQVRRDTRRQVPLLLTSYLAARDVTSPLWQSVMANDGIQVWQEDAVPVSASTWLLQEADPSRLRTQILFSAHARFVSESVLPVLAGNNPDMPAVGPAAVLYHHFRGPIKHGKHSLWQQFLICHTTLNVVTGWTPDDCVSSGCMTLPDFILPFLPQGGGSTPHKRMLRRTFCLFTFAVLVALGCSGWNNRQLLHRLSFDISQYQHIAMSDYLPKAKAVNLNGWHQGMMQLQQLADRLNGLDEKHGKYMTVSELKSQVFGITRAFGRSVPVEEQLRQLALNPQGQPLPAAQQSQTEMSLNALLNRYGLIVLSPALADNVRNARKPEVRKATPL